MKRWILTLSAAGLMLMPRLASAQLTGGAPTKATAFGDGTNISASLSRGFDIIITVAAVVFIVLLFYGGFLYLISLGNEDGSKKARQLMLDAVIGIIIVAVAWAVGNWILRLVGIVNINPDTI